MAKDKEPVDIIEEDYLTQGVTSPKELIIKHLDRISLFGFKGDVNPTYKQGKDGVISTSVDRRVITMQAIDFLQALLEPYYDQSIKDYQKNFDKLIETIEQNLWISSINSEAWEKCGGDSEGFKELVSFYQEHQIISIKQDSPSYEVYLTEKYSAYQKFFKQLNYLLKRKNYLEGETFGESPG